MTAIDLHPSESSTGSRCVFDSRAKVGLCIVLLLAAATRLIALGSLDVWGDEVYSHDASSDLFAKLLKWETISNESSSSKESKIFTHNTDHLTYQTSLQSRTRAPPASS